MSSFERRGRAVEDRARADDEVHARRDHRRGVDERGDGRRACHRVAEPRLERELCRLAARREEQHEADRRELALRRVRGAREDRREVEATERREHEAERDDHADVRDAVHDERLLGGRRVRGDVVPEADEQVRREAHALPADEQQEVGVREDEQEHRRDEEVEVREEASPRGVVLHVRHRVEVDERAHEGHEEHEGQRQRVEPQACDEVELGRRDPREEVDLAHTLTRGRAEQVDEDPGADDERQRRGEQTEPVTPAVGAAAEEQQDAGAHEGRCDEQPRVLLPEACSGHGGGDLGRDGKHGKHRRLSPSAG